MLQKNIINLHIKCKDWNRWISALFQIIVPFLLQVPSEDKFKRVHVRPISTAELVNGQNIVLSVFGLEQRSKQISTAVGKFKLAEQLDAATDQMQYLITVSSEGGIAQIKMPKTEWDSLTTVGIIEEWA